MKQHASDPFTLRYMRDIGHYEFGHLHKPIAFAGFDELSAGLTRSDLDYWLAYWIAAFEAVMDAGDHVHFLSYEALCANGREGAVDLCEYLDLDLAYADQIGDHFRPVPPIDSGIAPNKSPYKERAEALHSRLLRQRVFSRDLL